MIHRRADGPVPIGPLIDQVLLRHRIPHTADMPRTKKADLAAKASRLLQLKDQAGELYRQADALLSELVSELGVGRSLALSEGVQFERPNIGGMSRSRVGTTGSQPRSRLAASSDGQTSELASAPPRRSPPFRGGARLRP